MSNIPDLLEYSGRSWREYRDMLEEEKTAEKVTTNNLDYKTICLLPRKDFSMYGAKSNIPDLLEYSGRSWREYRDILEKDNTPQSKTTNNLDYETICLLPRKDFSMYGEIPKLDTKELLECDKCGAVLLPCIYHTHCNNPGHDKITPSTEPTTNTTPISKQTSSKSSKPINIIPPGTSLLKKKHQQPKNKKQSVLPPPMPSNSHFTVYIVHRGGTSSTTTNSDGNSEPPVPSSVAAAAAPAPSPPPPTPPANTTKRPESPERYELQGGGFLIPPVPPHPRNSKSKKSKKSAKKVKDEAKKVEKAEKTSETRVPSKAVLNLKVCVKMKELHPLLLDSNVSEIISTKASKETSTSNNRCVPSFNNSTKTPQQSTPAQKVDVLQPVQLAVAPTSVNKPQENAEEENASDVYMPMSTVAVINNVFYECLRLLTYRNPPVITQPIVAIPLQNKNTPMYTSHPMPLSMATRTIRKIGSAYLLQNQRIDHQRSEIQSITSRRSGTNSCATSNTFHHRPNILKNSAKNNVKVAVKRLPSEKLTSENNKHIRLNDVNGFILHSDVSESAEASMHNNTVHDKVTFFNMK